MKKIIGNEIKQEDNTGKRGKQKKENIEDTKKYEKHNCKAILKHKQKSRHQAGAYQRIRKTTQQNNRHV